MDFKVLFLLISSSVLFCSCRKAFGIEELMGIKLVEVGQRGE